MSAFGGATYAALLGGADGGASQYPTGTFPPSAVEATPTQLAPAEEQQYQQWKGTLPPRLQYEGDYDLRGFYKKNPGWSLDQPEAHMTDEFKLPNHPTFSNESRYYNKKTHHLAGHWEGNSYIPFDERYKQRVDE
jgi:hypothetical protein